MKQLLLLLLLHPFLYSAAISGQKATVSNVEFKPSKAITGASEYTLSGTVNFEHNQEDYKSSGDSAPKNYVLTISFKERRNSIKVNQGFEKVYGDNENILLLQTTIKLSQGNLTNYPFAFNVPAAAFNLPEGSQSLTPVIELTDNHTLNSIPLKEKIKPLLLNMPRLNKVTIWVKRILVDSLDKQGNLWDYFILNPIDGNPDLSWGIDYAGRTYYRSRVQKNTFEYWDEGGKDNFSMTIADGDTLTITVKDLDDLTPDDLIDTVLIPTANFQLLQRLKFQPNLVAFNELNIQF